MVLFVLFRKLSNAVKFAEKINRQNIPSVNLELALLNLVMFPGSR